VVILDISSAQDALDITAKTPKIYVTPTVGSLKVTTDAATKAFNAELNIVGRMQLNAKAVQEDGLQKIALEVKRPSGGEFAVSMNYGKRGVDNLLEMDLAAGEAFSLSLATTSHVEDRYDEAGKLDLKWTTADGRYRVTADLEQFIGEVFAGSFTLPKTTAPIEEIRNKRNSTAVKNALKPLMDYLERVYTNSAA
jgi:hypothetical protein